MSSHGDNRISDEELLDRLRAGEWDLFGHLVRRYERELFGYLRRYLGDEELAADVFQNTFLQIFIKIEQYQPGRPARPWLYAITTNQAIDALRRRARRADTRSEGVVGGIDESGIRSRDATDLLADPGLSPPEMAEHGELREQVRAAVDRLPETLRQVVLLAYFQGMRYQEIADVLEIPLGTVKSRLHTAMHRLAEDWPAESDSPGSAPPE